MGELTTPCNRCGNTERIVEETPNGPHFGKLLCGNEHFQGWAPMPNSDKVRRPSAHRELVRKHSRGYCEMCRLDESELPARHTLEGHHVKEYQDCGSDDRDNVWVICTKCHKLIHWVRNHATLKST